MTNFQEISRTLADTARDRALIERALAPGRVMADVVKALESSLGGISEIARAMQPPAHLTAVSQMMAAMAKERQLLTEIARPIQVMDDLTKHIAHMRSVSESMTAPYRAIQEALQSQSAVFESLSQRFSALDAVKLSIPDFSRSTLAWDIASIGLATRMKDIGLFEYRERLSARLLEVPKAYTEFVRQTTERLSSNPSPAIAARLRGSLMLSEQQLLDIADSVSGFVTLPEDDDEPDSVRELTAPYTQQDDLLALESFGDEDNIEAMAEASPTALTVSRARRVLELITQCNEAGKTSAYGIEIFKPTTRLMTVFGDLPWLAATDRFRMADVVDCLYFIFYEGAGKDNLRFLDKQGGPLTDDECDLIWCIKHLRNKWSRHDPDHGKDKDIQRSWAELAAKFRWLGLAEHPTDSRHFQQLHAQLLILAEDFLARILQKLKLKQ